MPRLACPLFCQNFLIKKWALGGLYLAEEKITKERLLSIYFSGFFGLKAFSFPPHITNLYNKAVLPYDTAITFFLRMFLRGFAIFQPWRGSSAFRQRNISFLKKDKLRFFEKNLQYAIYDNIENHVTSSLMFSSYDNFVFI